MKCECVYELLGYIITFLMIITALIKNLLFDTVFCDRYMPCKLANHITQQHGLSVTTSLCNLGHIYSPPPHCQSAAGPEMSRSTWPQWLLKCQLGH